MSDDNKQKHMDYIQDVITRMNSNSFMIKGWAITITSAIFVLSQNNTREIFLLFSVLPIMLFWILDGFYLSQERKYRKLYDVVRMKKEKEIDFSMNPAGIPCNHCGWLAGIFSKTLVPFYGILVLGTVVFYGSLVLPWLKK